MAKLTLQQKLGQQLTMTPQLQQAIRLLQMPVLELNSKLLEALESNILLDQKESSEINQEKESEKTIGTSETEHSDWGNSISKDWSGDDQIFDPPDTSYQTLQEHLLWQLQIDNFTPRETAIGETIVNYIDEDGYLSESLETISDSLEESAKFTMIEIKSMLKKIQNLDPLGIGARSPEECISIQLNGLRKNEPGLPLAIKIASNNLEMVGRHDYTNLRRELSVSDNDLNLALTLIRNCHPHPGSAFQINNAEYVEPDVFVRYQDGKWIVELNRTMTPNIFVNQQYAEILNNSSPHSDLSMQLQEARWLVRSLEIRNNTLTRVAITIVEKQIEFLEHGEESMKPMVLRDIAEELNMHESTISRVTTKKYMHTPR
ncbi:MAG: RNA polymerase factor sigma-54, partial [Pseudomonadota bacterium]|nr:RNA polymerase factor sigma-54 [Pseudomonadota bacterium]